MGELILQIFLLVFFIWYLVRLLCLKGKQSSHEPFWIPKEIGIGIGINPRNKAGFWVSLIVTLSILGVLIAIIVSLII